MSAYYSDKEHLFVGIAPAGQREEALKNAIAMAKGFYGTDAIDYEKVPLEQHCDVANDHVRIRAFPQLDALARVDEQKEVTIISDDPYQLVYIPDGGDIGIPFFTARGASLVLTRSNNGSANLTYVVTIVGLGHLHHRFEYPTSVYSHLLKSDGQTAVAQKFLGTMHANCTGSYLLTLRSRSFSGDIYPLVAKARIEFTLPEFFDRCPR
jgi:hypothetical protein